MLMVLDNGVGMGDGGTIWSVRRWKRHARKEGGERAGLMGINSNRRKRKIKREGIGVEGTESRKKMKQVVMQEGDDNTDLAVVVVQPRQAQ